MMSVTIKDIAQVSGVSYSTVSKALNDSPLVKPDTKKKILQVAKDLGYTPNFVAKNLVSKKSNTIGLVWPTIEQTALSTLVTEINKQVVKNNYFMMLSINDTNHAVEMFQKFRVDGVIIFEAETPLVKTFDSNLPILTHGVSSNNPYPIIDVNHRKSIYEAVLYLNRLGHKKISYVGFPSQTDKRQIEKLKGFRVAMNEIGLKVDEDSIISTDGLTWYDGYTAAKKLLQRSNLPTALINGSYDLSLGILRAVNEFNLKVPEDISIISYDNIPQMARLETPLTSVGVPVNQLAEKMVNSLLDLINKTNSLPLIEVMEPEITKRGSCSNPTYKKAD
jgi:LacI family transcriptional regulator